jgi:hypothetical protein
MAIPSWLDRYRSAVVCPILFLCNQVQESASHFLFKCRITIRIWNTIYLLFVR